MNQVMENIGLIVFIAVIVISVLFNTVSAKIKEAAAAAERSRDYQKKPHKFNPFSAESPEEFFERVREEEKAPKKLKLNKKHQIQNKPPAVKEENDSFKHFEEPVHDVDDPVKITQNPSTKRANMVNIRDKKSLRKAIIINEVLSPPKAYDF